MSHRDADITDVVVVLDCPMERVEEIVGRLKQSGMDCVAVDADERVVEGCIDSTKVHDLQKVECVRYVRSVFTYTADYPLGDPRDKDLIEDPFGDTDV